MLFEQGFGKNKVDLDCFNFIILHRLSNILMYTCLILTRYESTAKRYIFKLI